MKRRALRPLPEDVWPEDDVASTTAFLVRDLVYSCHAGLRPHHPEFTARIALIRTKHKPLKSKSIYAVDRIIEDMAEDFPRALNGSVSVALWSAFYGAFLAYRWNDTWAKTAAYDTHLACAIHASELNEHVLRRPAAPAPRQANDPLPMHVQRLAKEIGVARAARLFRMAPVGFRMQMHKLRVPGHRWSPYLTDDEYAVARDALREDKGKVVERPYLCTFPKHVSPDGMPEDHVSNEIVQKLLSFLSEETRQSIVAVGRNPLPGRGRPQQSSRSQQSMISELLGCGVSDETIATLTGVDLAYIRTCRRRLGATKTPG